MGTSQSSSSSVGLTAGIRRAQDANNKLYQLVDLRGGGELVQWAKFAVKSGDFSILDGLIEAKMTLVARNFRKPINQVEPFLYENGRNVRLVSISDLIKHRRQERRMFGAIARRNRTFRKEDQNQLEVEAFVGAFAEHPGPDIPGLHPVPKHREICWDIEQRGVMGETVLHMCLLNGTAVHNELAKRLIQTYPKLVNDIFISDEYYGQSALHQAITNEDTNMVQYLLSHRADVHQRCYGAFFSCEDQKSSRADTMNQEYIILNQNTNYRGKTYWGEYPLSFAVCLGQVDCFRMLIANNANPNRRDTNGNTVLHMAVLHDRTEMFDLAMEVGAGLHIRNNQKLTPLTLAAKLGNKRMFEHVLKLESNVLWVYGGVTCAAYPLQFIDTIDETNGEMNGGSALSIIVKEDTKNHLKLLDGFMEDLLREKWNSFAKRELIKRFVLYLIYLAVFFLAIHQRPSNPLFADPSSADSQIVACLRMPENKLPPPGKGPSINCHPHDDHENHNANDSGHHTGNQSDDHTGIHGDDHLDDAHQTPYPPNSNDHHDNDDDNSHKTAYPPEDKHAAIKTTTVSSPGPVTTLGDDKPVAGDPHGGGVKSATKLNVADTHHRRKRRGSDAPPIATHTPDAVFNENNQSSKCNSSMHKHADVYKKCLLWGFGKNDTQSHIRFAAEAFTLIGALSYITATFHNARSLGFATYFKPLLQFPEQVIFHVSWLTVMLMVPCRLACLTESDKLGKLTYDAENILALCAIFGTTINVMFFCRGTKFFALFVHMIFQIIRTDMLRVFAIEFIFCLSYAQSFYIIFTRCINETHDCMNACHYQPDEKGNVSSVRDMVKNDHDLHFLTFDAGELLIRTFLVALGESQHYYAALRPCTIHILGQMLLVVYQWSAQILLINMLIASVTKAAEHLGEVRETLWRRQRAKMILLLEHYLNNENRLQTMLKYSRPVGTDKERRAFVVKCIQTPEERAHVKLLRAQKWQKFLDDKRNALKRHAAS